MKSWITLFLCLSLTGCATLMEKLPWKKKKEPRRAGVYRENLDSGRLVDLSIVKKVTGKKKLLFFSESTSFLEGYIRGVVVDYDDNPIQGIVVRATYQGKDLPGFDPGISDVNGVYRIRFSQPIKNKVVDISGSIYYNPPWEQQLDLLGSAIEPQTKETKFRLYYNQEMGIIGIGEDIPKTIAKTVTGAEARAKKKKQEQEEIKRRPQTPPPTRRAPARPQSNDDFFGGFGDFGN